MANQGAEIDIPLNSEAEESKPVESKTAAAAEGSLPFLAQTSHV